MGSFSLSRDERIRGRTTFDAIFKEGKMVFSRDKVLRAFFITGESRRENPVQIAAAVSKKSGNAVWRNRVKRLIREAYRLNKNLYIHEFVTKNLSLQIVFSMYCLNSRTHKTVTFAMIEPAVLSVMERVKKTVLD